MTLKSKSFECFLCFCGNRIFEIILCFLWERIGVFSILAICFFKSELFSFLFSFCDREKSLSSINILYFLREGEGAWVRQSLMPHWYLCPLSNSHPHPLRRFLRLGIDLMDFLKKIKRGKRFLEMANLRSLKEQRSKKKDKALKLESLKAKLEKQ